MLDSRPRSGGPLDTGAVAKAHTRGTHRFRSPEETVEWLRAHAPAMGVTRVANLTGLDELGIPVAAAYRPNSRALSVSQGKGLDLAAAKASALMEAIEGWHAERIERPLVLGRYDELVSKRRVVDVSRLPSVEGSVFHESLPILWIEARSAADGEPALVPYEVVHTNYTLPVPQGTGCFQASSNGLAGGNHPVEALSHAVCELVERDAVALWWSREPAARAARRVDLATVDDADCAEVLERYASRGVRVGVWEITSDVEIPCFFAIIAPQAGGGDDDHLLVADGMGCHPSRPVGLLRALLEAAQSRLTVIAGVRDDLTWAGYRSDESRDHAARLRAELDASSGALAFRDGPDCSTQTLDADVRNELAALAAAGLDEVLVVDLSQADSAIPVVRAVVPGLEGVRFQPGYVPGARARALSEGTT